MISASYTPVLHTKITLTIYLLELENLVIIHLVLFYLYLYKWIFFRSVFAGNITHHKPLADFGVVILNTIM